MDLRRMAQRAIDELQFRFDVFPTLHYQPLPWLGLNTAKRGEGTEARWQAIEQSLDDSIKTALDIGCNVGYFCFSLAFKRIPTLGIEMDDRLLRIARYAARKLQVPSVGFCNLLVDRNTVALLPQADLVLLLSVWHHWVRAYGLEDASQMLAVVWKRTKRMLFFETGEAEMPSEFGLSALKPSAREWLENYLCTTCPDATVTWVGSFKAFAPKGNEVEKVAYRNLFKLMQVND